MPPQPLLRSLLRLLPRSRAGRALVALVSAAAAVIAAIEVGGPGPVPEPARTAQPAGTAAISHRLAGRIVRVMDGDTVRLQTDDRREHTIRVASIDAPETGSGPDRPGQPFSQASRRALEEMVGGRALVAPCYEVDHYGRDVCDLPLPDGGTAAQALVRQGLAWANMQYGGKFMRDPALPALEGEAREARRGLWSQQRPVEPWNWRRACWGEGRCE